MLSKVKLEFDFQMNEPRVCCWQAKWTSVSPVTLARSNPELYFVTATIRQITSRLFSLLPLLGSATLIFNLRHSTPSLRAYRTVAVSLFNRIRTPVSRSSLYDHIYVHFHSLSRNRFTVMRRLYYSAYV